MMKREIILGPPGTGKTTELIRRLEVAFEKGIGPEEIAYLAFTKKAANEAIVRSMKHFGFARDRFPYFRTIHSLAYHENKISKDSVMHSEDYREFGETYGWDFTASYDNYEERPTYGRGLGDQLLKCYDLAKARGISVYDEARRDDYPFNEYAITRFVQQFETFVSKTGLKTFNDFLTNPIELDLKLVIIDEAQDLTHLQWSFIRDSFRKVEEILIAGDDDQCIYQWSGADLNFFLNIMAERTVLNHSFRCHRKIWELCNSITSKIVSRYPKPWQPVRDGGSVIFQQDPFEVDIRKGEWLVLARKNRSLKKYYQVCMSSGRIFHDGRDWINRTKWFNGVLTYMALQQGKRVSAHDIGHLLRVSTKVSKIGEFSDYSWEDLKWNFSERPNWDEVCDMLEVEHLQFIRRCIAHGEDITTEGSVRLSTIHGAKGGEADNVLLDARLDGIPSRQFRSDPDSERRVWYVGVSRARQNLILCGAIKNKALGL